MPKYHLKPFAKLPGYEVTVLINCNLSGNSDLSIDLEYSVTGNLNNLKIEESVNDPQRTEELWKKTCFELFLNNNLESNYIEFNFSSTENWNSYFFDNYRTKADYVQLPRSPIIKSHRKVDQYNVKISLEFNYPNLINLNNLFISPTVILQHTNGTQSFWAVNHDKNHPDFHLKNSFFPLFS